MKSKSTILYSKTFWIFITVFVVGIFLRTYNFQDWLRFSSDQSRDALMLGQVLDGEKSWPLLGPLAGGTGFYLGPAYYYFSLLSGKIFGNYPDKLAYPSLFFSILTIPLLYLFLKEHFGRKISLTLTALMSVSYFAVANSRFSSNPNLTPFFILLFLFSFLKLINNPKEKSWFWPSLLGLSLGIGIQLHTTLLVIMPFMTIIFLAWLFRKTKKWPTKTFLIILFLALALNLPQITSEFKTKGANTVQFFASLFQTGEQRSSLAQNLRMLSTCQIKANANILTDITVTDNCSQGINLDIKKSSKEFYGETFTNRLSEKTAYVLNLIFVVIFSLAGYLILIFRMFREKEDERKNFLKLVLLYNIVSLFFLIPVAPFLYINYFIILFFIPFVLLGLYWEFFENKIKYGKYIIIFVIIALAIASLNANLTAATYSTKRLDNNLENSNLKWAEDFADFFAGSGEFGATVYLSGENKYLDRYAGPIRYMLYQNKKEMVEVDASQIEKTIPAEEKFIYIKNEDGKNLQKSVEGYAVVRGARISPVDIYILRK